MAVVAFDYAMWLTRFPEFTTTPNIAAVAPLMFEEASLYVSNTDASPICNLQIRTLILNLVTAHLVAINYGVGGETPSPLVGRISNAAEGTVNVAVAFSSAPTGSKDWYSQTKYGAQVWAATAPYRAFRYMPPVNGGFPAGYSWGVWPYLWPQLP